ncbi:MAG TPA: GTPase ObgE [Anaerolineaceae bacterium]|jgi:GTP-binding protein|nr:GTPase ObgE [Anaerolineaceae bacterium]HOE35819.1 GTPase ObgE [Anaerolineaceae bacterium]HOT26021.1 GTPase ObgE [Anaerolineaceae bacterium]HQH58488.1 GTPase ObgE [Anaerolineaceae bacterium]HQK02688.1 GTPase ObgE [Anaerolineaceae bacterium]
MFIDSVTITVESGKGGDGMVHMHREKYRPRGGPDGGDGGKGGSVILQVVPTLNTLNKFHHNEVFTAENGKNGGPSNQSGKSAPDLIIPVPPGTIVYDEESAQLLGDLVKPGQTLVVAKGGRGGRGNQHFASSRNQMPLTAERGEPGEVKTLRLELKLIADVGLIGMPNAGKSSFLAATTNAKPKIADYPFTTLEPNLGVVELDQENSLVLADIPGLIEGAHQGVGLGYDFLRHIQRTRVLIHILDGLSPDPYDDYLTINQELQLFDERLGRLPQIVVFNKMDLPDAAAAFEGLRKKFAQEGKELLPISAVAQTNLKTVLWRAHEALKEAPIEEVEPELPVYRAEEDPRGFTIEKEDDLWVVRGKIIERAAAMTFWDQPGSVRRFQRLMTGLGVEKALREAGIQEGDTVSIGDYELEWQD